MGVTRTLGAAQGGGAVHVGEGAPRHNTQPRARFCFCRNAKHGGASCCSERASVPAPGFPSLFSVYFLPFIGMGAQGSLQRLWPRGHEAPCDPRVSRAPAGQLRLLHICCSARSPTQAFPPCRGSGLLHTRVRSRMPPAQVTEQADHGDQGLQRPWTAGRAGTASAGCPAGGRGKP